MVLWVVGFLVFAAGIVAAIMGNGPYTIIVGCLLVLMSCPFVISYYLHRMENMVAYQINKQATIEKAQQEAEEILERLREPDV